MFIAMTTRSARELKNGVERGKIHVRKGKEEVQEGRGRRNGEERNKMAEL